MWLKTATALSLLLVLTCPMACAGESPAAPVEQSAPTDGDNGSDCQCPSCFCSAEFVLSHPRSLLQGMLVLTPCLANGACEADDTVVLVGAQASTPTETPPTPVLTLPLLI
jgi:hypothetical protein